MSTGVPEFQKPGFTTTPKGPGLEALADRLFEELPKQCENCPLAFALRCAVSEDDWLIPQTPRSARDIEIYRREDGGTSILSTNAEQALRSVVRQANEEPGEGPRGEEDSVCCQDNREIECADYSSDQI